MGTFSESPNNFNELLEKKQFFLNFVFNEKYSIFCSIKELFS
jgi:hypothetical protein